MGKGCAHWVQFLKTEVTHQQDSLKLHNLAFKDAYILFDTEENVLCNWFFYRLALNMIGYFEKIVHFEAMLSTITSLDMCMCLGKYCICAK